MSDTFALGTTAQSIASSPASHTTVSVGVGTVYYSKQRTVSSTSNEGSLTVGETATFTDGPRWLISTATGARVFISYSPEALTDMATQAELDAVAAGTVSVTSAAYGAVGDGTTDDTTAIQAAITAAAAAGGVVTFPPRVFKFSKLTVPKGVTLAGAGWNVGQGQGAFGASVWTERSGFKGTILVSTATTGEAISSSSPGNSQVSLRDFLLIGPGSGTSSGIKLGESVETNEGVISGDFRNVLVVNFATCWDLQFVLDCTFTSCRARGCKTGLSLSDTTNQNVFVNTEVQFSSADGILLDESGGNAFYGGLLQNISGTAGVRIKSPGETNTFDGFWSEAHGAGVWCYLIEAGGRNRISNAQIATDSEDFAIKIKSAAAATTLDKIQANEPTILIEGAVGTFVNNLNLSANFTDSGTGTVYNITGKVGFFGKAPAAKQNVKPAGEVTAKELCEALEAYGLIE